MNRLNQPWPLGRARRYWIAAAAAAVALLAILAYFDGALSRFGQGMPDPLRTGFEWITRLGESDYLLLVSLAVFAVAGLASFAAGGLARPALRQLAAIGAFVFCGVGFPGLVSAIIKRLIGRARPEWVDPSVALDVQLFSWLDWRYQSFPSGHATTAFALCFVVSFLAPRAFVWMLGLAVLIALSRIVLGVHYPTDIVGGAIVGVLGAYLVRVVFASRGWLFETRDDGAIAMKPLKAIRDLFRRRES